MYLGRLRRLLALLLAGVLVLEAPGLSFAQATGRALNAGAARGGTPAPLPILTLPVSDFGGAALSPDGSFSPLPGLQAGPMVSDAFPEGRQDASASAVAPEALTWDLEHIPEATLDAGIVGSAHGESSSARLEQAASGLPTASAIAAGGAAEARGAGSAIADRMLGTRSGSGMDVSARGAFPSAPAGLAAADPRPAAGRAVPGPSPRAAAEPATLFQRLKGKLLGFFQVLPDPERNREFWKYTVGQALMHLGVSFHYRALPEFISPTKEDSRKIGQNRAANWTAQAASSLATGPLVDRSSVQKLMTWTYLGRSLLLMAVPVLYFLPIMTPAAFAYLFAGVIFATGFIQAISLNAQSVAFNRIIGHDEAHYNKANAVYNIVVDLVGVIGPILAGIFIAWSAAHVGFLLPLLNPLMSQALIGNALCYGVYALLMLVVAGGYAVFLRLPRDEMTQIRRDLDDALKDRRWGLWSTLKTDARFLLELLTHPVRRIRGGTEDLKGLLARWGAQRRPAGAVLGVTAATVDGKDALLVEVAGDPSQVRGLPSEFSGVPVQVIARRSQFKELREGLRLIAGNRFLKISLLFSTLYLTIGDSLAFTALPRLIDDVLAPGGAGVAGSSGIPVLGPILSLLMTKAGAFGLFLAAGSLGITLASIWMMRLGRSRSKEPGGDGARRGWFSALLDRLFGRGRPLDPLERQGIWSSLLHGAGMLAYWGVFFWPGLWGAVGFMLLSSFLMGPAAVIWTSLTQRVIQKDHPNDQGKVYAAMLFYQLIFSVFGVLFFGELMTVLATKTALFIAALVLTGVAVVDVIEPFVAFPLWRGAAGRPKK